MADGSCVVGDAYEDFVRAKVAAAPERGFAPPLPLSEDLFPFQREMVRWVLARGCAVHDLGRGVSLRVTVCASGRDGVQVVATAQRSVTTGSGAVEVAVGCGPDVAGALAELDRRLRGGEEAAG